jgi:hypothetical protein
MTSKILAMFVLLGSLHVYAQDVSAPASIESSAPTQAPEQVEASAESHDENSASDGSVSTTSIPVEAPASSSDSGVLISEQPTLEAPTQSLPSSEVRNEQPDSPVASAPSSESDSSLESSLPSSELETVTPSVDGSVAGTNTDQSLPDSTPVVSQDDQGPAPASAGDAVNGNSGVSREDRKAARDVYKSERVAARDERKEAMKKFRDDMKAARALSDGERKTAMDAARAERKAAFQKFRDAMKAAREKFWVAIGRGKHNPIAIGEPVKDELDNSKEEVQEQSDAQLASVEGASDDVISNTDSDSAEAQKGEPVRDIAAEEEALHKDKEKSTAAIRR